MLENVAEVLFYIVSVSMLGLPCIQYIWYKVDRFTDYVYVPHRLPRLTMHHVKANFLPKTVENMPRLLLGRQFFL